MSLEHRKGVRSGERVTESPAQLGGVDEGYESAGSEGWDDWRESSVESSAASLNFEWVSMAVGCGPVLPVDLSDAMQTVGLEQREVPMYSSSCLGKRGRACLLDEEEVDYSFHGREKKRRWGTGGASPETSRLFEGFLSQTQAEMVDGMDVDIPIFRL